MLLADSEAIVNENLEDVEEKSRSIEAVIAPPLVTDEPIDLAQSPIGIVQLPDVPDDPVSVFWTFVYTVSTFLAVLLFFALVLKVISIWRTRKITREWGFHLLPHPPVVVGFFHPYCNAGGGGERVLWQSIKALQYRYNFIRCVIYTGDKAEKKAICDKVKKRFGIDLQDVEFVFLKTRKLVEATTYPRFTLLLQSLGSIFLGIEAFLKCVPDVYIDSMGYAFTMPLFKWLGRCKTASYVHYPVVSEDMLSTVRGNRNTFNNANWISRSPFLTRCKIWYYRLFAKLYGFVGRRSSIVMVNSTWTHRHISKLWQSRRLFIVYPPCDTSTFQKIPLSRPDKCFTIISVAQFRPEKNHRLQLEILKEFLGYIQPNTNVKLVLVGSCRNEEDQTRVSELKKKAKQLKVDRFVQFKTNLSFKDLQEELKKAKVALHTMENEHFGIVLPECMAAGCVMVAHNSGGPRDDILVNWKDNQVGYLADSKEHMASHLMEVYNLSELDRRAITEAARAAVNAKFSVNVFEASFLRATEDLFG